MTIIANLDAAIEQHYAEVGNVTKEIQIFGRVWTLEPTLTTAQLDPLLKVQAAAEIANDASGEDMRQKQMAAIAMVGALPEILASIVVEAEREEFREKVRKTGIPLKVIPTLMEVIFTTYDAAPFTGGETTSPAPQHPTNTQLLGSTIDSGNSLDSAGQRSSQPSSPLPTATPVQAQPTVPEQGAGLHAVPSPETASQPYQTQVPPGVQ